MCSIKCVKNEKRKPFSGIGLLTQLISATEKPKLLKSFLRCKMGGILHSHPSGEWGKLV